MDVLTKLAKGEAKKAKKFRRVKRYEVLTGSGHHTNFKLYERSRAFRIAARAKRMGMDVYVGSPMFVVLEEGE
jgi:hypothetical protein